MATTPVQIGTLIVVVLKARNLPNKRHIGKQDPYCTVTLNGDLKRTKAVKRGGQHPEWDEELRFPVFEDVDDILARTSSAGKDLPPVPPKDGTPKKDAGKVKAIKGGKSMRVQCYADDPREPEFIGEGIVDLNEALSKGETDEWFTIYNKEKYQGEVYLELTFWSNEKPPEKKPKPRPSNAPVYGGPGTHQPTSEVPPNLRVTSSSSVTPTKESLHPQVPSGVDVPPSLRPSSSLANIDLYIPLYEKGGSNGQAPRLPPREPGMDGYDELGMGGNGRRGESMPARSQRPVSVYDLPGAHSLSHHPQHTSNSTLSHYASATSLPESFSDLSLDSFDSGPYQATAERRTPLPRPHSQSFSGDQLPSVLHAGGPPQEGWAIPPRQNMGFQPINSYPPGPSPFPGFAGHASNLPPPIMNHLPPSSSMYMHHQSPPPPTPAPPPPRSPAPYQYQPQGPPPGPPQSAMLRPPFPPPNPHMPAPPQYPQQNAPPPWGHSPPRSQSPLAPLQSASPPRAPLARPLPPNPQNGYPPPHEPNHYPPHEPNSYPHSPGYYQSPTSPAGSIAFPSAMPYGDSTSGTAYPPGPASHQDLLSRTQSLVSPSSGPPPSHEPYPNYPPPPQAHAPHRANSLGPAAQQDVPPSQYPQPNARPPMGGHSMSDPSVPPPFSPQQLNGPPPPLPQYNSGPPPLLPNSYQPPPPGPPMHSGAPRPPYPPYPPPSNGAPAPWAPLMPPGQQGPRPQSAGPLHPPYPPYPPPPQQSPHQQGPGEFPPNRQQYNRPPSPLPPPQLRPPPNNYGPPPPNNYAPPPPNNYGPPPSNNFGPPPPGPPPPPPLPIHMGQSRTPPTQHAPPPPQHNLPPPRQSFPGPPPQPPSMQWGNPPPPGSRPLPSLTPHPGQY